MRDDPNVKNVYRGLEWHNPELTLEDKELGLNLAARLSQPFNEISDRILDMMADVRKVYPTKWDEDYLINDPENAVVDPALVLALCYLRTRKQRRSTWICGPR